MLYLLMLRSCARVLAAESETWTPIGMGKGKGGGHPPEMLNSVFLLQMQEVFMHYFEKMSSASRGFPSRPLLGNCSWTLLGDFRPSDPLIAHPWKKSCGRPCNGRHSVTLGKH